MSDPIETSAYHPDDDRAVLPQGRFSIDAAARQYGVVFAGGARLTDEALDELPDGQYLITRARWGAHYSSGGRAIRYILLDVERWAS